MGADRLNVYNAQWCNLHCAEYNDLESLYTSIIGHTHSNSLPVKHGHIQQFRLHGLDTTSCLVVSYPSPSNVGGGGGGAGYETSCIVVEPTHI